MLKIFDEKFSCNKIRYIIQCLLATLSVFLVLLVLDVITDTAVVAALGASSFIAFTMPEARASQPRFLVGGYLIGIIVGTACCFLSSSSLLSLIPVIQQYNQVIFGALAVGLAIFLMVVTNSEHPPAAAVALGLAINSFNLWVVIVALVGIILISTIKTIIKPLLINLL